MMIPKPSQKPKRPSRKSLVHLADRLVSAYAILGDRCCTTCGAIRDDLQPGHFFKRRRYELRWDMKNIALQCPGCNHYHNDNSEPLRRVLIGRLGEVGFAELERRAHLTCPDPPLADIIEELRAGINILYALLGLPDRHQQAILNGRFTNKMLLQLVHGSRLRDA